MAGGAVVLPDFLFRLSYGFYFMNSIEQRRKKRAVYTGLQPLLSDSELVAALRLWEEKYAARKNPSVRYFIEEVVESIDGRMSVKALLPVVVKAFYLPESDLLSWPDHLFRPEKRCVSVSDYTMPELEAFKLLVTKWMELAGPTNADDAREYVLHAMPNLGLPRKLEVDIANWLHQPAVRISHLNVTVKDLQSMINLFYMAFCTSLGPVKADELLSRTVERLRNNGGAAYQTLFSKLL